MLFNVNSPCQTYSHRGADVHPLFVKPASGQVALSELLALQRHLGGMSEYCGCGELGWKGRGGEIARQRLICPLSDVALS